MGKILSSSPGNIRYNGTGRAYAQEIGTSGWEDLGEIESRIQQLQEQRRMVKDVLRRQG